MVTEQLLVLLLRDVRPVLFSAFNFSPWGSIVPHDSTCRNCVSLTTLVLFHTAIGVLITILLTASAWAQADGEPRLDPTYDGQGTVYAFALVGSAHSMDPASADGTFMYRGSMTLFQGSGPALRADMQLDTNGDGSIDREALCDGTVGKGRFGLDCYNYVTGRFDFAITGLAKILDNGKLAMRKATGRGFMETATISFGFSATQQ